MSAMASQITSVTIVYSTVYSRRRSKKYLSSASLAFVRGIHRWPVNSPHKGLVTRKMFPFDDVIMTFQNLLVCVPSIGVLVMDIYDIRTVSADGMVLGHQQTVLSAKHWHVFFLFSAKFHWFSVTSNDVFNVQNYLPRNKTYNSQTFLYSYNNTDSRISPMKRKFIFNYTLIELRKFWGLAYMIKPSKICLISTIFCT